MWQRYFYFSSPALGLSGKICINLHEMKEFKKSNQKLFSLEWILDYTVILVYNALL